ncbi:hypothetical protein A2160_06165 [Candidatus Beckwithbacteria bacterium RBG_13_42_9]|uniref:GIY-YIG domain-containing protein n=1 Tax=Candidatus Beckwithbacteria bacterium RBG_13_42_9 TaxID=1797457 RepID=A0A1F5E5J3_9BACT|nr:MAG: hypothetical protein A2160_06165 [Candidatus Beckwithbacteria bacterium RBG_13_42_9]
MYYAYILYSRKDNKLYYGHTCDLIRRCQEHQNGKVQATKGRRPLILVYYEAYLSEIDAINREKSLKTGKERERIKERIRRSLEQARGGVA